MENPNLRLFEKAQREALKKAANHAKTNRQWMMVSVKHKVKGER